ncbi:hypothetical protein EES42_35975 [Streptomyces sp. ADI95-17]|nr:hypothetical protein EES42_35975 [Streptomyces sp. ADI95-17]
MGRIAGRFARVEPRRRARAFVLGLLSELPRKNCWTLAEHAGDANPYGLQHLLSRAKWDADAVRDDIRGFVVEHLHDTAAVLVVDETGDLKKGTNTVGVQRQYTGTAGRIENSQVAVYLAYSTRRGHAAIDRELYVPRFWTEDTVRCRAAGIPDTVGFATKPALAARMIGRALDAGVPASWVAGDEVYGGNPHLRTALEKRQVGYVLTVARDHQITTRAGKLRADTLVKRLPRRAWQKLSAGAGARGHRFVWFVLRAGTSEGLCVAILLQPGIHRRQTPGARARHDVSVVIESDPRGRVPKPPRQAHDGLVGLQLHTGVGVPEDVEHVRPGQLVGGVLAYSAAVALNLFAHDLDDVGGG